MGTSQWAQRQFGSLADDLVRLIPLAVRQAHELAMAAQAGAEMPDQDAYGHTLKIQKGLRIVAAVSDLPGTQIVRPKRSRCPLVRIVGTGAVLFPWRHSTSNQSIQDAKMKLTSLKEQLFLDEADVNMQLSIDSVGMTAEQIDAEIEAQQELTREFREWAKVVIVGFASNSKGLFNLGWGQARVTDRVAGTMQWHNLEALPVPGLGGSESTTGGSVAAPGRPLLRPVQPTPPPRSPRFDDAALDEEDFGITPRSPLSGEPSQEPTSPPQGTGTGEPGEDE